MITSPAPLPASHSSVATKGRTIAIGDIHGCARALDSLLELIAPTPQDTIVTLGDYVDRGPQSREVVERLLMLEDECQLVPLMGNHERLLLDAFENKMLHNFWTQCGGQETLDSYGGTLDHIPTDHRDFFSRCLRYYETDHQLFFHANFNPRLAAAEQEDRLILWEHLRSPGPGRHISGKRVFVGHTPQEGGRILKLDHVVCLDTYCFGNGCLSAMEVDTEQIWQANQRGVACLWEPATCH